MVFKLAKQWQTTAIFSMLTHEQQSHLVLVAKINYSHRVLETQTII